MESELIYSTETPPQSIKSEVRCKHGKNAGQTCYPCEIQDD